MKAIIVKSALSLTENSLKGHVWDMQRHLATPDSMYGAAELVLKSHPNLMGCGMAFRPDFYPEKGRLFEPYVFKRQGQYVRRQLGGPDHDYTKMPFFKNTLERNAPVWSDAYYDSVSHRNMVTFSIPIFDEQEEVAAVLGVDVDADWLGDTLNYRHIYPSSYDFLLTEAGQLIAGPKLTREKKRQGCSFSSR